MGDPIYYNVLSGVKVGAVVVVRMKRVLSEMLAMAMKEEEVQGRMS